MKHLREVLAPRRGGLGPQALSRALVLALMTGAPLAAQTQPDTGPAANDLASLQALAVERNPSLLALRAAAEAAASGVVESGTRPDPVLMLGAMNLGLPEFDAGMPASMLPSVQLSQTFPFFGKLGLRESIAEAEQEAAELALVEAEWTVRASVAERYHAVRALQARIAVQLTTLELLREFQTVARSLYASGQGQQSDVLRADVEVARTEASTRRLRALVESEAAALEALLDLSGQLALDTLALPGVPAQMPPVGELLMRALESRPILAARSVQVEGALRAVELAERDVWPDFTISAQVGRRAGDDPRTMGGLMIGASLPIQRGSRQEPRIAMAGARVRGALAEEAGARAMVETELRVLVAELDEAASLLVLYRDEILPTARANVSSSLASYRVGEIDFATLVDAQLAVDRYEQDFEQLVADYGATVERIESAIAGPLDGPRISPADLTFAESGNTP
jgi:outer membrane protein TolC